MRHAVADITFWYDPISPYAYLAFERLPDALMGLSVQVRYRPVLFGALLQRLGQLGPAEIPGKRDWTYRQVQWLAREQGVPLDLPAAHPFNPLPLLRLGLACAHPQAPGETSRYVTERLFHHVWRGGGDPVGVELLQVLSESLADHMLQCERPWTVDTGPGSDAVKQRLRANTDEALAQGVFGVPLMVCDGQPFWGQDALPMLRAYLEGDAWFDSPAWTDAGRLPVGIRRPVQPAA